MTSTNLTDLITRVEAGQGEDRWLNDALLDVALRLRARPKTRRGAWLISDSELDRSIALLRAVQAKETGR